MRLCVLVQLAVVGGFSAIGSGEEVEGESHHGQVPAPVLTDE